MENKRLLSASCTRVLSAVLGALFLATLAALAAAQPAGVQLEGIRPERSGSAFPEHQRRDMQLAMRQFSEQTPVSRAANSITLLRWPLRAAPSLADPGYYGISSFVDHNPSYPDHLMDYNCGQRTYDLAEGYNHAGTDIFTWPFYWHKMDKDEVEVVAAAWGRIVYRRDGNDDRSCGLDGGEANAMVLQHDDGSFTVYGHMKRGSLGSRRVGETVDAGDRLGIVGSSGMSTGPHLHFEVWENESTLVDPFVGTCNTMSTVSWWEQQPLYYSPSINKISTHSAEVEWQPCPQAAVTNLSDEFELGSVVYLYVFGRDLLNGERFQFHLRRPDGSHYDTWTYTYAQQTFFPAYYLFYSKLIPKGEMKGTWMYVVEYRGVEYEHSFILDEEVPVTFRRLEAIPRNSGVELVWDLYYDEPLAGFRVYRTSVENAQMVMLAGPDELGPGARRYFDSSTGYDTRYSYIVSAIREDGSEIRSSRTSVTTGALALSLTSAPNPFNPATVITFSLANQAEVDLAVFDIRGARVRTLLASRAAEGAQEVVWNGLDEKGSPVGSGVYICRLQTGHAVLTRKLILLR